MQKGGSSAFCGEDTVLCVEQIAVSYEKRMKQASRVPQKRRAFHSRGARFLREGARGSRRAPLPGALYFCPAPLQNDKPSKKRDRMGNGYRGAQGFVLECRKTTWRGR